MQNCEWTPEEMAVLREILQHAATDLDIEIHRTDSPDFKDQLKHRRLVLDNVQVKLGLMATMA